MEYPDNTSLTVAAMKASFFTDDAFALLRDM
jgi:hypothetical protein